jgi:hypothetical protein
MAGYDEDMENSRSVNHITPASDTPPPLPPETFAADRWVPCLVEPDEECLHLACQAMEPLETTGTIDAVEDVPEE